MTDSNLVIQYINKFNSYNNTPFKYIYDFDVALFNN